MQQNLKLAAVLAETFPAPAAGGRWSIRSLNDVKLRAFIPPGESLQLEATRKELAEELATIFVQSRNGSRVIGGARVELVPVRSL